jgi:hypothetical protein
MRFPSHLFQMSTIRSEPLMAAMAVIAIGMFIGAWVIGPALTHDTEEPPQAIQQRTSLEAMMARPDPSPYRSPTPQFDMAGAPQYGAAAKAKALAELGGEISDDEAAMPEQPRARHGWSSRYYPRYDRHKVY